jgi:tetratricopeptide (TPR) repeat protein
MSRRCLLAFVALGLAGCVDHGGGERVGDDAYVAERYRDALAAYMPVAEARPDGRIWAKVGAAALHAGEVRQAIAAYRALAGADVARRVEAADGLERAAAEAERRNDPALLEEAVETLRAVAPERGIGRFALGLSRSGMVRPTAEDLAGALTVAGQAGAVDTLLARYGRTLRQSGNCAEAVPLLRAALRRAGGGAGGAEARAGLAECALRLGQAALADTPARAEEWFRTAAAADSSSDVGRLALVGVGDARVRQGDVVAGAISYQAAIAKSARPDSVHQLATRKLNALASAGAADSI